MTPVATELPSINIDAEWTYRRLGPRLVRGVLALLAPVDRWMRQFALARIERLLARLYSHYGPEGILGRTWLTGSTALAVAVLLGLYLLLYYV